jgi:hypothetical protein
MMRIGEFALASGLTVKALHHYDAIDLLKPTRHSATSASRSTPSQIRSSNDTEHMSLTNAHDKMLTRRKGPR